MAGEKRQLEVDPDAPPSEEEIAESAKLREALADPTKTSDDADILRALANAHAPPAIDALAHRAIVAAAVARKAPRRGVVVRVAFGVATVFAAAALIVLFVRTRLPRPLSGVVAMASGEVSVSRSTQPLFTEPFAPQGGESARIDRIAMAREADLRENRFARWGVR